MASGWNGPSPAEARGDLVRVGHLIAPLGVAGALRLFVIGDVERLLGVARLWVEGAGWLRVRSLERHGPGAALHLAGVDGREAAERLRGRQVFAHEAELSPLPEGEYYYHDLIGLAVRSPAGEALGTVTDVLDTGQQDLLVVSRGGGSALVPLQAPYVEVRPHEAIVLDAPPGLLEA